MRASDKAQRLVGDGVELRRHDRANYPLYALWYSDEEIWRLTSWAAEPMQPEAVERLFEEREKSSVEVSFAIHREGEEEPLGIIGLMNISEANASSDLSVIIGDEEHRDRGLGTEAIRVILRYAFEHLALERVNLSVFEFNEPAISSYAKIGFKKESRISRAVRRNGAFCDAITMRILGSEWREDSA